MHCYRHTSLHRMLC